MLQLLKLQQFHVLMKQAISINNNLPNVFINTIITIKITSCKWAKSCSIKDLFSKFILKVSDRLSDTICSEVLVCGIPPSAIDDCSLGHRSRQFYSLGRSIYENLIAHVAKICCEHSHSRTTLGSRLSYSFGTREQSRIWPLSRY